MLKFIFFVPLTDHIKLIENMTQIKENITTKLLSKEVVEQNKTALEMVNFYTKVSDIIERTHIAMGKKNSYKIAISSTKNQKLNTHVCATTN